MSNNSARILILVGAYQFFLYLPDYAVSIFHDALQTGKHSCYLRPDCMLPMMYIDDCIKSLHEMMIAPEENLSCRVYNVAGMSFTPDILYNEVKKHVPNLAIEYNIDDRQKIGKIQMKREN